VTAPLSRYSSVERWKLSGSRTGTTEPMRVSETDSLRLISKSNLACEFMMLAMGQRILPDDVNQFLPLCTIGFRKVIWRDLWWTWFRRWT
jgi:hypothetical protein